VRACPELVEGASCPHALYQGMPSGDPTGTRHSPGELGAESAGLLSIIAPRLHEPFFARIAPRHVYELGMFY
jgi:hypothetical protein